MIEKIEDWAGLSPAQQRRVKRLRFSPECLDAVGPNHRVVMTENALPDDATACGLSYSVYDNSFFLLIASASFEVLQEGCVPFCLPPVMYARRDEAEPDPFLAQLHDFLRRAKESVSVTNCLADVVIFPAHYTEGLSL